MLSTSVDSFLEGVLLGSDIYLLRIYFNHMMTLSIVTIIDLQSCLPISFLECLLEGVLPGEKCLWARR